MQSGIASSKGCRRGPGASRAFIASENFEERVEHKKRTIDASVHAPLVTMSFAVPRLLP
jgi:hypothetical protein